MEKKKVGIADVARQVEQRKQLTYEQLAHLLQESGQVIALKNREINTLRGQVASLNNQINAMAKVSSKLDILLPDGSKL